jgi:hypothetical protein
MKWKCCKNQKVFLYLLFFRRGHRVHIWLYIRKVKGEINNDHAFYPFSKCDWTQAPGRPSSFLLQSLTLNTLSWPIKSEVDNKTYESDLSYEVPLYTLEATLYTLETTLYILEADLYIRETELKT